MPATPNRSASATRLDYIDGLRGLAIAVVLILHAGIWSGLSPTGSTMAWLSFGRFGVDLFLVLSGFCLFWPLVASGPGVAMLDLRKYIHRRARRILPPFYAALAVWTGVAALVHQWGGESWWHQPFQSTFPLRGADSFWDFATHLGLVHGFVTRYSHSFDGAFWSLSLEWQFYFLLPLLVWMARRWSIFHAFLLTLAVTFLFRLAVKLTDYSLVFNPVWNETCLARWAEFGAGLLIAGVAAGKAPLPPWLRSLAISGWFVAACLMAMVALTCWRGTFFLLPPMWGLAVGVLVAHAAWHAGKLRHLLEFPPLVRLGTISYSLYLFHGSVFLLLSLPLSRSETTATERTLWYFGPGLVLAIGAATIAYRLVEAPFTRPASRS
jgi:peptidoglycan/LPS O-acetylase OafA/YrhL